MRAIWYYPNLPFGSCSNVYRALGGGWQSRNVNEFVPDSVLGEMRERTDWGNIIPPEDLQEAPSSAEDVDKINTLLRKPDF